MFPSIDWNDANIARLRALWDEGHSAAEIGRRMGVTKNAIIGKSHRLELRGRESPIRRGVADAAAPRRPRPSQPAPTLPALPSAMAQPSVLARPAPVQPAAAPPPPPRRRHGLAGQPCCWPLGEPGTRGFRFCEGGSEQGRPYCAEHSSLAFLPRTERPPATA